MLFSQKKTVSEDNFDKGEYQWVAKVTNTIVYADPENTAARLLCADALEQLGYQAESGTWRNAYLSAALELHYGNSSQKSVQAISNHDAQKEMTASMLLDYMAILLDKQAMAEQNFTVNFNLTDTNEQYAMQIKNGVLLKYENTQRKNADATVTCQKNTILYLLIKDMESFQKAATIDGDVELLNVFSKNLNQLNGAHADFNIIEP